MTTEIVIDRLDQLPEAINAIFTDIEKDFKKLDFSDTFGGKVVPLLKEIHEKYFNEQAGPEGNWPPLAQSTIDAKGFSTILIEHGNMKSSLLNSSATQFDHIEDISEAGLTWGTADEKAPFHMSGTKRMPARPFVGLTEQGIDKVAEILADATVDKLKE